MSEPFIGQIIMFGGNFAPRNWALCDGQLLSIEQNTALFSILGTIYGGDGRTTFALPDLRGRVAMHAGNGPGLTPWSLGQKGGGESNTLTTVQMPSHNHTVMADANAVNTLYKDPDNATWARASADTYSGDAPNIAMNSANLTHTGGGQAVNNMQPFQCVNYIIALMGIYPSRN